MRATASTVDALYTNAALPRIDRYLVYYIRCCKKYSKMQHILLIMDSHRAPWQWHIFRKMLSWLTRKAATYRFRDIRRQIAKIGIWEAKNGQAEACLDPHLETAKDIATKRGKALSGIQLCHHANFHAVAEISVSGQTRGQSNLTKSASRGGPFPG